jgi:hypothetical protein
MLTPGPFTCIGQVGAVGHRHLQGDELANHGRLGSAQLKVVLEPGSEPIVRFAR